MTSTLPVSGHRRPELDNEMRRQVDALCPAANDLSIGQIYLTGNPRVPTLVNVGAWLDRGRTRRPRVLPTGGRPR